MSITIADHMTPAPHTIGLDQPMSRASALMREHAIRHLPVLTGGELLGLVSHRDIALVEGLEGIDPANIRVEEAMTPEPYAVTPETPLVDVVRTMGEKKYGAAVVMKGREVVGIFTTIDALRVLADRL